MIALGRQFVLVASGAEALADGARFRLRRRSQVPGRIPGAFHSDRIGGLRQRRPLFHLDPRRCERLLVEMRGHFVALLRRILVAFFGREEEPLEGFGKILLDPDAARVKDGKVILAVGDAAFGRFAEPLRGGAIIRRGAPMPSA